MSYLEFDLAASFLQARQNTRIRGSSGGEDDESWTTFERILLLFLVVLFYTFIFYLGVMGQINFGNLVPLSRLAQAKTAALNKAREETWAEAYENQFGNGGEIPEDDPDLVAMISIRHLYPPRPPPPFRNLPFYNHTTPLSKFIREIFGNKTNGFFVEYRTFHGEIHMESFDLENNLDWSGLIIEPDPLLAIKALRLYRNLWVSDACLLSLPNLHKSSFIQNTTTRPVVEHFKVNDSAACKNVTVQCVPLLSLLLAVNVTTTIDYFVLDNFDAMDQILKVISFSRVSFKVIAIRTMERKIVAEITDYLERKGYRSHHFKISGHFLFVHSSLLPVTLKDPERA